MALIDRVIAHYKGLPREVIEVPEWGDDSGPVRIYYTVPTLHEVGRVRREAKGDEIEMAARLIALKAEDESGNKLFQMGDHMKMTRMGHPEVVSRVSAEITKHLAPPDPREAEKNSETISED
jgi:hypothetical protein